jgi:hypothetical protein
MQEQIAKRDFTDLGGGVYTPPGAVVMTVADYGSPVNVEYVSAAVHEGSNLIASEIYRTCESSDEQIATKVRALAEKHNVRGVFALSGPVPVEFHECGQLVIRIADGKGGSIPTYKPYEDN